MAEWIPAQGDRLYIEPGNTKDFTLEELQGRVGGYIELVQCPDYPKHYLVVNDEGALRRMPINTEASVLARQPIYGDAVFCLRKQVR